MLQLMEVDKEEDDIAKKNESKKRKRKGKQFEKMTWTCEEGFPDNSSTTEEKKDNKINVTNAQHICSEIKTIILSPKILQKEKHVLKIGVQFVGEETTSSLKVSSILIKMQNTFLAISSLPPTCITIHIVFFVIFRLTHQT